MNRPMASELAGRVTWVPRRQGGFIDRGLRVGSDRRPRPRTRSRSSVGTARPDHPRRRRHDLWGRRCRDGRPGRCGRRHGDRRHRPTRADGSLDATSSPPASSVASAAAGLTVGRAPAVSDPARSRPKHSRPSTSASRPRPRSSSSATSSQDPRLWGAGGPVASYPIRRSTNDGLVRDAWQRTFRAMELVVPIVCALVGVSAAFFLTVGLYDLVPAAWTQALRGRGPQRPRSRMLATR